MSLDATDVNAQLSYGTSATANLQLSCQGIINTHITPSASPWYGTLNAELQRAQALAQAWQAQYDTNLKSEVLTSVVDCGKAFQDAKANITQLFDQASSDPDGAKAGLLTALGTLKAKVQTISTNVATFEQQLKSWGQSMNQVHDQLAGTIGQIQAQENALQAQIASINSNISSLQSEIVKDRNAIADAESQRNTGIVETIFGILFAPITGGLSLILAGIGVSSLAEAQSRVTAMQDTINDYQARIVSTQLNMTQDQTQLATLSALTFSAGIALSDIDVASQTLDKIRTSWDAFFQEIGGIITKISNAQDANAIIVEKVWFVAACNEWDLIVTGTQGLIDAPQKTRSVTVMQPGDVLNPNQSITSADGQYAFVYQGDGNLVLYRHVDGRPLWASNTSGSAVGECIMQGDGNLVIYAPGGNPVWASNTAGNTGSRLVVQGDGNVVIYRPDGTPVWATNTWVPTGPTAQGDDMQPGDVLNPNQSITSADGNFVFVYQGDGNLVLYYNTTPLWASGTDGKAVGECIMQGDGNLVIYAPGGNPVWASNTAGNTGSRLVVQGDGNVVIYRPDGTPVWATNTVQVTVQH